MHKDCLFSLKVIVCVEFPHSNNSYLLCGWIFSLVLLVDLTVNICFPPKNPKYSFVVVLSDWQNFNSQIFWALISSICYCAVVSVNCWIAISAVEAHTLLVSKKSQSNNTTFIFNLFTSCLSTIYFAYVLTIISRITLFIHRRIRSSIIAVDSWQHKEPPIHHNRATKLVFGYVFPLNFIVEDL